MSADPAARAGGGGVDGGVEGVCCWACGGLWGKGRGKGGWGCEGGDGCECEEEFIGACYEHVCLSPSTEGTERAGLICRRYRAPSRPLTEHTTFLLGDIVHSLKDLAVMATTERGKRELAAWIEGRDVRGVVEFWEEEWVAE